VGNDKRADRKYQATAVKKKNNGPIDYHLLVPASDHANQQTKTTLYQVAVSP
jgi:hypothetical protein